MPPGAGRSTSTAGCTGVNTGIRIALTAVACVLIAAALAYVIQKPSLDAARIDYRKMQLRALVQLGEEFHASNGRWPESLAELRLPDRTAEWVKQSSLVSNDGGVTACIDGECLSGP